MRFLVHIYSHSVERQFTRSIRDRIQENGCKTSKTRTIEIK